MYCRLTTFTVKPGKLLDLIAVADQMRDTIKAVLTAREVFVIELPRDKMVTIAVHDDEASAKAGEVAADAVYSQMGDYIDLSTLTHETGEVIWGL